MGEEYKITVCIDVRRQAACDCIQVTLYTCTCDTCSFSHVVGSGQFVKS